MCLQWKSFENTVGKGEIARKQQFLLFSQYFLTFRITFSYVYQISNCRLQTLSVWKSLKFVIWKTVKMSSANALNLDRINILSVSQELSI